MKKCELNPTGEWNLPKAVIEAVETIAKNGYEAYIVGGSVRNRILNQMGIPIEIHDYDIATEAKPDVLKEIFSDYNTVETGIKHGTVTVIIDKLPIEITTYRIERDYEKHRKPIDVQFTRCLEEDLKRRDFTINGIAYNLDGRLVDLFGGLEDLKKGLIRCIGEPEERFCEDALRILRGIRFACTYGFEIEENTAKAMRKCSGLLLNLSAERINSELTKALCGNHVRKVFSQFRDLLQVVIPEIEPMFDFEQRNPHHDKDVWEHTLAVIEESPATPVMRWAALLHDIGKPRCFSIGSDGFGHFYGHHSMSLEIAGLIAKRLKFSGDTWKAVEIIIRYHDTPLPTEPRLIKRMINRVGSENFSRLIEFHRADTLGQSEACFNRLKTIDEVKIKFEEILRGEECFSLRQLAINGNDLIDAGLEGKAIGLALNRCLEAVMDGTAANEREALLRVAGVRDYII